MTDGCESSQGLRAKARKFLIRVCAVGGLGLSILMAGTLTPVQASWLYLDSFSYGANSTVYVDLGQISYITGCSGLGGGIDDWIYPYADVYVVNRGGGMVDVSNANGIPNTLFYTVISEPIANTGPGGSLISGDYEIIIDECQNKQLDAVDWRGAEFSVRIPADVDPMSSAAFAAQLAATKAAADAQRLSWLSAMKSMSALFAYMNISTAISICTNPAEFILFACTNINMTTGSVYCSLTDAWKDLLGLQVNVLMTMANASNYYRGIAADPPDANFRELPVLDGGLTVTRNYPEPWMQAGLKFGEVASQAQGLAKALLAAMEKYQGAEQAGIGEYAFVQARFVEDYSRALAEAAPRVAAAFGAVAVEMNNSGLDYVGTLDQLRATQLRVAASGLTASERAALIAEGWNDAQIIESVADYLARDFSGLSSTTELADMASRMTTEAASLASALTSFADAMAAQQTKIAAQLRLPFPNANAGGPYTVNEGIALALDATATSHPELADNSTLTFQWDLDQDGQFDDATGQTPSVTFDSERDGYIGLKVSALNGYADVSYARLTVNNVNSAPVITGSAPVLPLTVPHDGSQIFTVTATDTDLGDETLTYVWDLDGTVVGSTDTYTYVASLADSGPHIVTVTVRDNSPLSPDTRMMWAMTVLAPDADGDGYGANVDCNDANAAIHPGAAEIANNSIDDDCDPLTPDDPDADDDGYDYKVDCNDANAAIHPGATEVCNGIDDNCSGATDEGFDVDGDLITVCAGDCDDLDATVHPGAAEVCDLKDNDCDGSIDEGFDADGDGVTACGGDCDDTLNNVHPGAIEVCDHLDNNCNGQTDEGLDGDGDGFTSCSGDCDDADATAYPGAPELCDSKDNDCDGVVDDGVAADTDGDGFSACTGDCNDADATVYTGAPEICDTQDNDCDSVIDEGFDADGDGVTTCGGDCNDTDPSIYPAHPEVFHNGKDDDCSLATKDNYQDTFIIVPDESANLYYAKSMGNGTWSNFRLIGTLSGIIRGASVADYDNDGDLDFVVGSPSGDTVYFYLFVNDGADNFTNLGSIGSGTGANSHQMDMAVGDFNHDGNMDFLGDSNHQYVHRGLGDGAGHFSVTTLNLGVGNGRGLDSADFNHDGHLDYVRAVYSSGQVTLYRGDGLGNFTSAGAVTTSIGDPYGLTAADFDNDGHPDFIIGGSSSGDAYFFAGNGNGTFKAGVYVGSIDFNNHGAYDNYDFNGDGNQDLVVSTYTSYAIYYYPGNGNGTFGAAVRINPASSNNSLGIAAPPGPPPVGDPIAYISPQRVDRTPGATVELSGAFSADNGTITAYEWDFGDGTSGSGAVVTHTFPNQEGNYRVRLTVTDNDGRKSVGQALVRLIGAVPVADAGGPYTFGESFAAGGIYSVTLDGRGSTDDSPIARYEWDFGTYLSDQFDGTALDTVKWAASTGVTQNERVSITGASAWNNRYLVSAASFPRQDGLIFEARVRPGTASYQHAMFGLKNIGTNYDYGQFVYAIYFNSGSVGIYEDGAGRGNVSTYTRNVEYDIRIILKSTGANYYMRPTGSDIWQLMYQSGYSTLSPVRFGGTVYADVFTVDAAKAFLAFEGATPAIRFREGSYPVTLKVTDIFGQTDTDTTAVNLVKGAPPVANPGGPYTPGEAQANCGNWTVALNGSGSTDDAGIYGYSWNFGDGTAAGTGATPSHVFAGNTPRTVTLTVTDNALLTNSASTTMTPTPGALPVARPGGPYTVNESAAASGLWTVNLSGTTSSDDVGLCDYQWNFGDGTSGTGPSPTHQYAAAGVYNVTLTVRDHALQSNLSTATTVTVNVNDPPVARHGGPYEVDETKANNGQWTAQFDGSTSTDDFGIWKYDWNFGDNTTGTGNKPTHVYSAPGVYTVTLTVTDVGRQTNTVTTTITVKGNAPPVADAGPALVTEAGLPVTLDASGSTDDLGIWKYQWGFDSSSANWSYSSDLFLDSDGAAVVTGAGGWGSRYLVADQSFVRNVGDSFTGRIVARSGGNRYVMWGLKNTSTTYSYEQWPYAIYFNNNSINIYEGGASRGAVGSFSDNVSYDLRIDVKAAGATYYYRQTGAASWTQLYDSTYSTATPFRLGATVHSGEIHMSNFTAPSGALPFQFGAVTPGVYGSVPLSSSSSPVVQVAYSQPGTYHPQITITDHAQQTDVTTTTVTVLAGAVPTAHTGGPYYTNEDVPTRFNGKASTDDFGIKSYTWDFGDGESITTRNFWVDHRYTLAGTYTATLTVADYSGKTSTSSTTVSVSAEPVVACVPWALSGGIEVPHDTWSGKEVTLKAVAWSLHTPLTYTWDFGDGSASATGTVADKRVIEAKHTYTGVEGAPFVATLTITDANGKTVTDNYLVRIRAKSIDIEINKSIDDGLWSLHKNQNLSVFAKGTYGNARIDNGYWDNGGGWGGTGYVLSPTSSAIQAFESNAHLELGNVRENPYVETVARGLRYIPHALRPFAIGMQTYGDPDTNHNGIGIEHSIFADYRPPYEGGQAMDALVASASKGTFAITGPAGIGNRTYYDLVVDIADAYYWGQYDDPNVGGGWRYGWNSHPDNSAAQWGAIGLIAAEKVWGVEVPQWVKDRNNVWMSYSYDGTGFGYTGPGNGTNTTPSGLVQLAFDERVSYDDPATTVDERDARWRTAENYIANNWNGSWWYPNSSTNNRFTYYGYYAFTKAMRTAYPKPITTLKATGLDWFKDETRGIGRRLVNRQLTDGSWPMDQDPGSYVGYDLTTAWSVIILTPTLFVQSPVADAGEDRVWGVDVPITLDGSRSYHLDPFRSIVTYEWDFDGDGDFDTSSTDPKFTHTYALTDYPSSSLPRNIIVTLKVTDNNDPATTDTDAMTLTLAIPPHPPLAVAGGPYTCTAGIPCRLDGSGSFDIDPTDSITAWQWDLNNDRNYGDATGEQPDVTFAAAGYYNIGLRVTDDAVMNDTNGNGVRDPEERLEDFAFATITVVVNEAPIAEAGGPYTVAEGSSVALDGTGSSDPNGNPLTYAWDLDNNGAFDDSTSSTPAFVGRDDGSYSVGLEVNDSLLSATDTATVIVTNVAPTVNAGPDQTINEGVEFIGIGVFTDPGASDSHTATVDYGDGSGVQPLAFSADGIFTLSHVYADNGGYTVTVGVTDDDGGANADTLVVTVNNVAPGVDAGPDAAINEGAVFISSGSFVDPGTNDTHTATVNYGDGSGVQTLLLSPDGGFALNHVYADNGTYTVTVVVTDNAGGAGTDTAQVTVNNVAPGVNAGPDAVVNEGAAFVSSGSFTDPGAHDTHTATVDYGDGTGVQSLALDPVGGFALNHVYADNGTYTVTVTVLDKDLGSGSDSALVTVNNVAPFVDAGPDSSATVGMPFILAATFTDPSGDDTHTATINWGDGTVTTAGTVDEAAGKVAGSHAYALEGNYAIVVTVEDDDGGVGSDSALLAVSLDDLCPNDPLKTLPGTCGCGVADTDSDQDGTPDCNDQCPNDVSKVVPGTCGCGVADTDSDQDGTPDCNDQCPNDVSKVVPGTCGCGVADTDSDQDGTPNCNDQCPNDISKVAPGACGCGVADVDANGNGIADCNDVALPVVTNLAARAKDSKIDITWTHVGVPGYNVYRSANGGPFAFVANTTSTYSVYADFGLTNGVNYCYTVRSVNAQGLESANSNTACAVPSGRVIRTR